MKRVRLSATAAARLTEIARWTRLRFGQRQAQDYREGLIGRVASLAQGELPRPRSCAALLPPGSPSQDLQYLREGRHYIILRETDRAIEVIDFIHQSRDLERLLVALAGESSDDREGG